MSQHRHARPAAAGPARAARDRWLLQHRNEVTEIIPLDGFLSGLSELDDLEMADLDDLDFGESEFDTEDQLLRAPELDDLDDTDNLTPAWLAAPGAAVTAPEAAVTDVLARVTVGYDDDPLPGRRLATNVTPVPRRGGNHHKQPTSAAKGRLLIGAMAAGATAAAAHGAINHADTTKVETVLTANASTLSGGSGGNTARGVQVVAAQPANVAVHNEELARGMAFAQERAQREARLQQPLFVMPTKGIFTSEFGYRWGVLHAGIDLANAIGTPIYAVSDGVVIDAGPTAGYGMWVKLRHADGTVTLYGHVNSTLVSVGERVMAGDQIATMGNRGNSTGPHLHFEVQLGGSERIDPVPWLAKRGLYVGNYAG